MQVNISNNTNDIIKLVINKNNEDPNTSIKDLNGNDYNDSICLNPIKPFKPFIPLDDKIITTSAPSDDISELDYQHLFTEEFMALLPDNTVSPEDYPEASNIKNETFTLYLGEDSNPICVSMTLQEIATFLQGSTKVKVSYTEPSTAVELPPSYNKYQGQLDYSIPTDMLVTDRKDFKNKYLYNVSENNKYYLLMTGMNTYKYIVQTPITADYFPSTYSNSLPLTEDDWNKSDTQLTITPSNNSSEGNNLTPLKVGSVQYAVKTYLSQEQTLAKYETVTLNNPVVAYTQSFNPQDNNPSQTYTLYDDYRHDDGQTNSNTYYLPSFQKDFSYEKGLVKPRGQLDYLVSNPYSRNPTNIIYVQQYCFPFVTKYGLNYLPSDLIVQQDGNDILYYTKYYTISGYGYKIDRKQVIQLQNQDVYNIPALTDLSKFLISFNNNNGVLDLTKFNTDYVVYLKAYLNVISTTICEILDTSITTITIKYDTNITIPSDIKPYFLVGNSDLYNYITTTYPSISKLFTR